MIKIGSPNVIVVVYVPACAPLHDGTANALKAGYRCSPRGINVVSLSLSVAGDIASDTSVPFRAAVSSKSLRNAMKISSQAPAVSYWVIGTAQ